MATFLTTRRMPAALAARVEASVSGRRSPGGKSLTPSVIGVIRFALFIAIVALVSSIVIAKRRSHERLEQERESLLQKARRESATVAPGGKTLTSRVEAWLARHSGEYHGDLVPRDLAGANAFATVLGRPTIYARGAVGGFKTHAVTMLSAALSYNDSFALCLQDPPSSRTEKLLLSRAREALAGGSRRTREGARVERLYDALVGLPFLSDLWQEGLMAARTQAELDKLQRAYEDAPLAAAKRAALARQLLLVEDEPKDGTGPTELDGEYPHYVRVELVDLSTESTLLRLRRRVDPGPISPAARAQYARGIDGCGLALDVREAVRAASVDGG